MHCDPYKNVRLTLVQHSAKETIKDTISFDVQLIFQVYRLHLQEYKSF